MKREFLQEFRVGEEALPKEVIDAIMAENGRDIQKAKAAFADYEELKTRLQTAEGKLQQQLQQQDWEEKYNRAVAEHTLQLQQLQFQTVLEREMKEARGKNSKAICALLDLDALKESEDQPQAIRAALGELKEECGYLFEGAAVPPYARDTGAFSAVNTKAPASLAGALREKFERK